MQALSTGLRRPAADKPDLPADHACRCDKASAICQLVCAGAAVNLLHMTSPHSSPDLSMHVYLQGTQVEGL